MPVMTRSRLLPTCVRMSIFWMASILSCELILSWYVCCVDNVLVRGLFFHTIGRGRCMPSLARGSSSGWRRNSAFQQTWSVGTGQGKPRSPQIDVSFRYRWQMFIACPDEKFPFKFASLGTVAAVASWAPLLCLTRLCLELVRRWRASDYQRALAGSTAPPRFGTACRSPCSPRLKC